MDKLDTEVNGTEQENPKTRGIQEWNLSARLESFDSYWQAPEDIEKGYSSFYEYYRQNYLPCMPEDKSCAILVISCGPGYLVETLAKNGYTNVLGIDSDPEKIAYAKKHALNCETAEAFPFLKDRSSEYDVIIPEQELNHLTTSEQITFLELCHKTLRDEGTLIAYGLNGANPFVGAENLAHNIDHFNTFTEYSLQQILELGGFTNVRLFPLKIYVFWKNPLNYVGLLITGLFELVCRVMFKLYGKNVKILSKKVAAIASK
jgi:2-polyprenyl-3-methyl-5-hydroxy-6-metoxy-1,4-benzoquinol methylase